MTLEQQKLLEKAARSLQAAQELNARGFAEFAASRTYYAMFYVATAFLEGDGLSYSRHSAVIAAFGQYFAHIGRVPVHFHRYLIDAERTRLRADYELDADITTEEAERLISRAEELLDFALTQIV
ncbi:MAG: HEPN domain-containing protein [Spirulina sp.]